MTFGAMPTMTATAVRPSFRAPLALVALAALVACSDLNDTQRRTLTGAGIGTATGALVGSFTGCFGCGAAIGAAAGGTAGFIFDAIEQRQGD